MKKNYDEKLLDLSKEVWGQKDQFIIEEPPSEDAVYQNIIAVGLCFPNSKSVSYSQIKEFVYKCESRFGKDSPQNGMIIGRDRSLMILYWKENLKEWRKRTHDVMKNTDYIPEDPDATNESSLSEIFDSLKTLAEETSTRDASFETEDEKWSYMIAVKKKDIEQDYDNNNNR